MSLEVVYGDILEQDIEAIVVPEIAGVSIRCELTARIYEAAGYQDMLCEYCNNLYKNRSSEKLQNDNDIDYHKLNEICTEAELHSTITVTSGFDLKANYAIHLDICEENWQDSQDDWERYHKECTLSNCYADTLDHVNKIGVRSIAFPVLGTCFLGVPEDFARLVAENAISSWLNAHNESDDNFIKVYLVIPYNQKPKALKAPKPAAGEFEYDDIFAEYERTFEKNIQQSGLTQKEFCRGKCAEYLRRIDKDSRLAKSLGLKPYVITRFNNAINGKGKGNIPKKKRVIALAIGMGLSDYERFEFIRCSGNDYPYEELDNQVETVIRSGIKTFKLINKKLCEINPDYNLSASLKKETEKTKSENIR